MNKTGFFIKNIIKNSVLNRQKNINNKKISNEVNIKNKNNCFAFIQKRKFSISANNNRQPIKSSKLLTLFISVLILIDIECDD